MPRIVKVADVRRAEILSAAYKLFARDGYEATTVNAIIDELGLSKGAFYHHFASKEEVLQALARQMTEAMQARLLPLVSRRDLTALEKLNLVFGMGTQFKREHVAMVRGLADLYCRDENLRLRARLTAEALTIVGPLYARILDEGKRDGSFAIDDPVETARLILHLGTFLQDAFGEANKRAKKDLRGAVDELMRRIDAYARALEGILGLAKHAITLVDRDTMKLFLTPEKPHA
jgi:AcrR family transcriptional regulator